MEAPMMTFVMEVPLPPSGQWTAYLRVWNNGKLIPEILPRLVTGSTDLFTTSIPVHPNSRIISRMGMKKMKDENHHVDMWTQHVAHVEDTLVVMRWGEDAIQTLWTQDHISLCGQRVHIIREKKRTPRIVFVSPPCSPEDVLIQWSSIENKASVTEIPVDITQERIPTLQDYNWPVLPKRNQPPTVPSPPTVPTTLAHEPSDMLSPPAEHATLYQEPSDVPSPASKYSEAPSVSTWLDDIINADTQHAERPSTTKTNRFRRFFGSIRVSVHFVPTSKARKIRRCPQQAPYPARPR